MIDTKTLIHAIELRKIISERNHQGFVDLSYGMVGDVVELLKGQPEIVRCKDCKYYRAKPGYCAYDRIWQENKGHIWGMYCKPDWFCADGKRKEGR